jgi:hypothetical protein
MNRPTAPIIFTDEYQVTVICPYCSMYHKHGKTITVGESRSADCHKGEYILGDVIPPNIIAIALKRREADCKRKRKPVIITGQLTTPQPVSDVNYII